MYTIYCRFLLYKDETISSPAKLTNISAYSGAFLHNTLKTASILLGIIYSYAFLSLFLHEDTKYVYFLSDMDQKISTVSFVEK